MATKAKTRSFLAAARVPNLPGVACHVIVGCMLAYWLFSREVDSLVAIPSLKIAGAATAGVLLCVAGNLLNDWHDREWDAKHRPERALPSGHFRPSTFLMCGSVCLFAGVALMLCLGLATGAVALMIAACVVIYTRCHKQTVWSVVPMAMCRGLLPLMGALAVTGIPASDATYFWWLFLIHGLALFLWVCGLSLDARGESTGGTKPSVFPWVLLLIAPLAPVALFAQDKLFAWFALWPVMLWLVIVRVPLRHTAKQRVSALLAGIPLLDFLVLAPIWNFIPYAPALVLWMPIIAFAAGRSLQRLAAAT